MTQHAAARASPRDPARGDPRPYAGGALVYHVESDRAADRSI